MISELVAVSAWIMPLPGESLELLLSLLLLKPESLLWPPPAIGLLPDDELPLPPGSGGKPLVPVDEPEPPWPNEPEPLDDPDPDDDDEDELSPPLPIIARRVLARREASALRSETTCMLPG